MELLSYLLKVSACSALFLTFYLLVLRKLTFFAFNRFYLLISLVASFVIPMLHFTIEREIKIVDPVYSIEQPQLTNGNFETLSPQTFATPLREHFDWFSFLPLAYSLVAMVILSLSMFKLYQLFRHTNKAIHTPNGLKLVTKTTGFTNCSFFNYVFIDKDSLDQSEFEVLMQHELVHARRLHSLDKLIVLVAKSILWFNPIIYLYDKTLEQVHEYEADEEVSKNFGAQPYAKLLLKLAIANHDMPLVHNFVKSPIKERIKMLFNSKSTNAKKLSYLLMLPICFALVWFLTVEVVFAQVKVETKNKNKLVKTDNPRLQKQTESLTKLYGNKTIRDKFDKNISLPTVRSASAIMVDTKNEISYLTDATIQISDLILVAKEATMDRKKLILNGKKASITINGKTIAKGDVKCDIKSNKWFVTDANGKVGTFNTLDLVRLKDLGKVEYGATDSVRVNKKTGVVSLFGNATIARSKFQFKGSKIVYDSKANTAEITDASYQQNGDILSARTISVDLNTLNFTAVETSRGKINRW